MKVRVAEGTQVVTDRIHAAGEVFDVPEEFEDQARSWLRAGYAVEVSRPRRKRGGRKAEVAVVRPAETR